MFGYIFIWAYLGVIFVMIVVSVSEMILNIVVLIKKVRKHFKEKNRENKVANLDPTSSMNRMTTRSMIMSTNNDLRPSTELVKGEKGKHLALKVRGTGKDEN